MLRKDVLVKRPEGTKIYRQRNCVYVYHVTGSEYKKDKKYVVEKRVCIGKMVDDENMNPNDNFYQYYEIVDGNEEEPPRFSDADLIKDLVSYMIIRETSTMQHYSDFAWSHLINSKKKWDDSKISDFFKNGIDYAQTELFVSRWNELQPEHSGIYISYDSTNMNTKAEGIEMAEFGHAKDDSGIPQVNISYAVNHADAKGYDFLMMIKTNSFLVTEMLKEAYLPLLTKARYYLQEHDVYGLTKKGTIGDDMTVRYFHIYYDNVRASQDSLESKTYVMFIASIVRNYLFQGLKKISKKEKDKKSYTVPASISELEKITIVKNSKDVYIRRYGLTKKQRSILTQFGVSESYLNKMADRMNLIV